MKNKRNETKLFMGIIGLAKTSAGMNCTYGDYLDIKQYFRYPGELLERMEEKGFTSIYDYISVMKGLFRIGKYHTEGTFVGSQLEDFLKRAKEKAVKGHSLILLYQVLTFRYLDPEPAVLSEEAKSLVLCEVRKNSLENIFDFLTLFFEKDCYWKTNESVEIPVIKEILNIKYEELMEISQIAVPDHAAFYMTVISTMHSLKVTVLRNFSETDYLGRTFGKELEQFILTFAALYAEPVKGRNEKFLKNMGFTDMDILNLNVGIWFLNTERTYLQDLSEIKWWRLKKKWFQELFHQKETISASTGSRLRALIAEAIDNNKMPQKIDGENITREFLLKDFQPGVPNPRNAYLLFELLTMKVGITYQYDSYNTINQVPRWNNLNGTYKLSVSCKENENWIRELVQYLFPLGIRKEFRYDCPVSELPDILVQMYAQILRECIADQKQLEEKSSVLREIFDQDVKEFLYQEISYFSCEQVHPLFESGYLDFSEFMRINKRYSKEYLKRMDRPYLLIFLKTFCESRNWIFTVDEANYLENVFKDSWVIGFAYYKKQTGNYLSVFSEEEQETLLGLMCELITRIPDICDLDDFMAGIISSTETRKILGAELSEQWYQFLKARNYKAMNSLRQDYLSEEAYAAFIQKEKKLEEEKKKMKEQEKLKEAKAALNDELNGISDAERMDILFSKIPSYISSYFKDFSVIAILDAYRDLPSIQVSKKMFKKFAKFFLECYDEDYISRKECICFIENLVEDTENE